MTRALTNAELNDMFRQSFIGGRVMLTIGIREHSPDTVARILETVRTFDSWDEGDDPYGEHDFGAFDDEDAGKVFWKIDYYDPSLQAGSEDPTDPEKTTRVLTILLAREW